MAAGRRGDVGEHGKGFSVILQSSCDCHIIIIHGAGLDGGR